MQKPQHQTVGRGPNAIPRPNQGHILAMIAEEIINLSCRIDRLHKRARLVGGVDSQCPAWHSHTSAAPPLPGARLPQLSVPPPVICPPPKAMTRPRLYLCDCQSGFDNDHNHGSFRTKLGLMISCTLSGMPMSAAATSPHNSRPG